MTRKVTLRDRVRYAFDNTMSRGPAGLILWLASISAVLVLGVSWLVKIAGADSDKSLVEIGWNILFQAMTPNPVDTKAGSLVFLGAMLFITFGSLFMVSIFIGILNNAIGGRIQSLRKGRSTVIEKNHTLVMGWSPQVFTIIAELVEANVSQRNPCIVVLADKDKVEMEDEIRTQVATTRNTRVVCRTGSPLDPADLTIVNADGARSIIILAPDAKEPDTQVIKTMLALVNNPERRSEPYHIVAEIRDEKNIEIAKMVGRDQVQLVLIDELISRITVQTCRQSGLSVVYTELLNFGGDDIYFKDEPALVGKTFGDALFAYDESAVIGLQTTSGDTRLNPPMSTVITKGDRIIVISEDESTIQLSSARHGVNEDAVHIEKDAPAAPEHTLILGWNRRAPHILEELDDYVAHGSTTTVLANVEAPQLPKTKHQTVTFTAGETTDRGLLDGLDLGSHDHIIVLSYSDELDAQEADARTLVTLLHLRDIGEKSGKEFSIVSEMLDIRNRQLAEVTRADDFIVSNHLVSLMLAQVSENKYLNAVFADLFDPAGSEIYLKPASSYVAADRPISFRTVVEAAKRRGETAIGYRLKRDTHDAGKSHGVAVNPNKSHEVAFNAGDTIIVLAES